MPDRRARVCGDMPRYTCGRRRPPSYPASGPGASRGRQISDRGASTLAGAASRSVSMARPRLSGSAAFPHGLQKRRPPTDHSAYRCLVPRAAYVSFSVMRPIP